MRKNRVTLIHYDTKQRHRRRTMKERTGQSGRPHVKMVSAHTQHTQQRQKREEKRGEEAQTNKRKE